MKKVFRTINELLLLVSFGFESFNGVLLLNTLCCEVDNNCKITSALMLYIIWAILPSPRLKRAPNFKAMVF
jgi:hypothetical protein